MHAHFWRCGKIPRTWAPILFVKESAMPPLTAEQLTAVQSLKDRMMARVEADPQILQQLSWLGQYLVDSENQLIALMNTPRRPSSRKMIADHEVEHHGK